MLRITEDTTSGIHDTLMAACDRYRYAELGVEGALEGAHRSCADNLDEGLEAIGLLVHSQSILIESRRRKEEEGGGMRLTFVGIEKPQFTPQPLNLFMNIPVHEDRTSLSFEPPKGKPGEYISLKAEMNLVVAVSACPQVSCFCLAQCGSRNNENGEELMGMIGYSHNQWGRA